ncbi:unnamed protein product, partial [Prorocentrum cordatum]
EAFERINSCGEGQLQAFYLKYLDYLEAARVPFLRTDNFGRGVVQENPPFGGISCHRFATGRRGRCWYGIFFSRVEFLRIRPRDQFRQRCGRREPCPCGADAQESCRVTR